MGRTHHSLDIKLVFRQEAGLAGYALYLFRQEFVMKTRRYDLVVFMVLCLAALVSVFAAACRPETTDLGPPGAEEQTSRAPTPTPHIVDRQQQAPEPPPSP